MQAYHAAASVTKNSSAMIVSLDMSNYIESMEAFLNYQKLVHLGLAMLAPRKKPDVVVIHVQDALDFNSFALLIDPPRDLDEAADRVRGPSSQV